MTAYQTIDVIEAAPVATPQVTKDWRSQELNAPDYEIWFELSSNDLFKRAGFFAFEFLKICAGATMMSAMFSAAIS